MIHHNPSIEGYGMMRDDTGSYGRLWRILEVGTLLTSAERGDACAPNMHCQGGHGAVPLLQTLHKAPTRQCEGLEGSLGWQILD